MAMAPPPAAGPAAPAPAPAGPGGMGMAGVLAALQAAVARAAGPGAGAGPAATAPAPAVSPAWRTVLAGVLGRAPPGWAALQQRPEALLESGREGLLALPPGTLAGLAAPEALAAGGPLPLLVGGALGVAMCWGAVDACLAGGGGPAGGAGVPQAIERVVAVLGEARQALERVAELAKQQAAGTGEGLALLQGATMELYFSVEEIAGRVEDAALKRVKRFKLISDSLMMLSAMLEIGRTLEGAERDGYRARTAGEWGSPRLAGRVCQVLQKHADNLAKVHGNPSKTGCNARNARTKILKFYTARLAALGAEAVERGGGQAAVAEALVALRGVERRSEGQEGAAGPSQQTRASGASDAAGGLAGVVRDLEDTFIRASAGKGLPARFDRIADSRGAGPCTYAVAAMIRTLPGKARGPGDLADAGVRVLRRTLFDLVQVGLALVCRCETAARDEALVDHLVVAVLGALLSAATSRTCWAALLKSAAVRHPVREQMVVEIVANFAAHCRGHELQPGLDSVFDALAGGLGAGADFRPANQLAYILGEMLFAAPSKEAVVAFTQTHVEPLALPGAAGAAGVAAAKVLRVHPSVSRRILKTRQHLGSEVVRAACRRLQGLPANPGGGAGVLRDLWLAHSCVRDLKGTLEYGCRIQAAERAAAALAAAATGPPGRFPGPERAAVVAAAADLLGGVGAESLPAPAASSALASLVALTRPATLPALAGALPAVADAMGTISHHNLGQAAQIFRPLLLAKDPLVLHHAVKAIAEVASTARSDYRCLVPKEVFDVDSMGQDVAKTHPFFRHLMQFLKPGVESPPVPVGDDSYGADLRAFAARAQADRPPHGAAVDRAVKRLLAPPPPPPAGGPARGANENADPRGSKRLKVAHPAGADAGALAAEARAGLDALHESLAGGRGVSEGVKRDVEGAAQAINRIRALY